MNEKLNDNIKIGGRFTEREIASMSRKDLEKNYKIELCNSARMSRHTANKQKSFVRELIKDFVNCDTLGKVVVFLLLFEVVVFLAEIVLIHVFVYASLQKVC